MAVIDALTAKARNLLKKTGDTMISGWLTLYQDPTDNLHAVTKQYCDANSADTASPRVINYRVGAHYTTMGSASTGTSPALSVGDGFLSPFYTGGRACSWDRIGLVCQLGGATPGVRFGIYTLDQTTLLPTALLLDAGAYTTPSGGSPVFAYKDITVSTTDTWIGLAWLCTGTTITVTLQNGGGPGASITFTPWGTTTTPTSNLQTSYDHCMTVTGAATGAMPAAGAWSFPVGIFRPLSSSCWLRLSA